MPNHDVNVYAQSVGAQVIPSSAKTGKGVQEIFLELTKTLLKQQAVQNRNGRTGSRGPKAKILVVDDEPKQKKNGGCCLLL